MATSNPGCQWKVKDNIGFPLLKIYIKILMVTGILGGGVKPIDITYTNLYHQQNSRRFEWIGEYLTYTSMLGVAPFLVTVAAGEGS